MTSLTPVLTETWHARSRRHVLDLLTLAWPVMLSRAGILVMAFADIAMLGRYTTESVALFNLALAVFIPLMVFSIGLTSGMVPVVSQAYGARNHRECGRAWCRAMVWGGAIGLVAMVAVVQTEAVLLLTGQEPALAAGAGEISYALAAGLPTQILFAVSAFYLESTRRPKYSLVAMLLANVLNVAGNWVLIFGNLGAEAMGAEGAAWASTGARMAAAFLMVWFILAQKDVRASGVRDRWDSLWGPGGWRAGAAMRKLGLSAGLSNGFETVGFTAMTILAGRISVAALASFSIAMNMIAMLFMVGLGLAVATGVRVGQAHGAREPREATAAGWTGVFTSIGVMAVLGSLVYIFSAPIAAIYTDDTELAARTAGVFLIAAFVCAPDCAQVVLGQAIRALGDAWVPVAAYVGSFILTMIPLAWWLTSHAGWDERGLMLAIAGGCVMATGLLAWRFAILARRLHAG